MSQTSDKKFFKELLESLVLAELTRYQKETGQELPRWRDRLMSYVGKGYYVTFTKVPELSLNPVNEYNTPTGIYGYPLDMNKLSEFATERPYAIVFRPRKGVRLLDLQNYSEQDFETDVAKLQAAYPKMPISGYVKEAKTYAKDKTASGYIWYVTYKLSKDIADRKEAKRGEVTNTLPASTYHDRAIVVTHANEWTRVFRDVLGYQGVNDNGSGIIHDNEPFQAVFWDASVVEAVDLVKKDKRQWTPYLNKHRVRNTIQADIDKLRQMLKTGVVKDYVFPSKLDFIKRTMRNVVFENSQFLPNTIDSSSFINVKFINSTFGSKSFGGLHDTTFKHVYVKGAKGSAFGAEPDATQAYRLQIEDMTVENAAVYGSYRTCKINGLYVRNQDDASKYHKCKWISSEINDYRMESYQTDGSVHFDNCRINKLFVKDCKFNTLYMENSEVTNTEIVNSSIRAVSLDGSILVNVDLTGLQNDIAIYCRNTKTSNVKIRKSQLLDLFEPSDEFTDGLVVIED